MYVAADGDGRATVASKRCPWSPWPAAAAIGARSGISGPVVVSLAVLFVTSVAGEIRCFCNQPSCVSTGYMCKSPLGLCFLETSSSSSSSSSSSDGELAARTIHACAEALPEAQRIVCAATARDDDVTSSSAAGNLHKNRQEDAERRRRRRSRRQTKTNLICCRTDMCNYKPRLLINIHVSRSNATSAPKETFSNRSLDVASHWSSSSSSSSSDQQRLWFRICIVAVPLIGAVVLGFIVFAAVRMFRKDRRLHHYSVGRHLPNDRLTTVPLANDTTTIHKDRTVLAVPQYLTSVSPLFPRPSPPSPPPPVRQPQWRTQRVRPTVGTNGLSERQVAAKIPISRRQSLMLSNGLCPVCVRDVYIVVDQRTD